MIKTITKSFLLTLFAVPLVGQNVGVGTATPATKLNVVQVADVIGIEVDHVGNTGNSIVAFPQTAANTSSVLWVANLTGGRGINVDMSLATGTAPGIEVDQDGEGDGIDVLHSNANGAGQFINMTNAANGFAGLQTNHAGTGPGNWINMTNTGAGSAGVLVDQDGTGPFSRGVEVGMDAASTAIGVFSLHNGTGVGVQSQSGGHGLLSFTTGANTIGAYGNAAGATGTGVYGFADGLGGLGLRGLATGADGSGGLIQVDNAAASANSLGLLVLYNGTGTTGNGGGNAMEVQHDGSNGNAIDIFIGDPSVAPGPANTTNEYSCLSVSHLGTGVGTAGYKSALQASVNGGDPAIISFSNSNVAREGILSFANPNANVDPISMYGYSYTAANLGYGVGVRGVGGWYGLEGFDNSNLAFTFAVYGNGDYGGTGAKYFSIDHPLDPANKILNHYSIESNEITNMYRGIVTLDANGEAVVELPDYFDAVNINPSYQLTAIGTATQPYVLEEEANNQFKVAGAPNTKVSWTVYAKRNDPTIRYFDAKGKNYDQEVVEKPSKLKGKYYTPEAYGQPATMGVSYDANFEDLKDRAKTIKQEAKKVSQPKSAISPAESAPKSDASSSKESKENREMLRTIEANNK